MMTEKPFKLPSDLTLLLQCSICKYVISCGPVYVKKNNENTCGRCVEPRKSRKRSLRNLLYEAIAKYFMFSCIYKNNGCKMELKWDESLEHEKNCPFVKKLLSCPILIENECEFRGSHNEILNHCQTAHKDLIVDYPFKLASYSNFIVDDMKKLISSIDKRVFIIVHDFLFEIHLKICYRSEKITICVSLLNDLKINNHFEFQIMTLVSKELNQKVLIQQVLLGKNSFDEAYSINLSFNSGFELTIQRVNVKCLSCQKEFEKITSEKTDICCDIPNFVRNLKLKSKRTIYKCLFFHLGCQYTTEKRNNLGKHQIYFCRYLGNCSNNIFDFLEGEDEKIEIYFGNTMVISCNILLHGIRTILKHDEENFFITVNISYENKHVFGLLVAQHPIIIIKLLSSLPADEDHKKIYKATIHFDVLRFETILKPSIDFRFESFIPIPYHVIEIFGSNVVFKFEIEK